MMSNLSIFLLSVAFLLLSDLYRSYASGNARPVNRNKPLQHFPPILYRFSPTKAACNLIVNNPTVAKKFASWSVVNKKAHLIIFHLQKPFTVQSESMDKLITNSCNQILRRGSYLRNPRSEIEKNFPIAFIRVVYRAYHLQELLLNLMYAPQNLYCYALDRKSDKLFHDHMRNLSECFPNVILTKTEYDVDSAGHNMTRSYLECLNIVWRNPRWKYAVLLQNDDIPLKTNYEIVKILDAFNGSNVINIGRPYLHRLPPNTNWSYAALNLFKNQSRNRPDVKLKIAKGSSAVILARRFVDFIMKDLNLTALIQIFDSGSYGTDEMLFQSLHSDDSLDAPGGFTRKCIDQRSDFVARYVAWSWSVQPCRSGIYRHNVCIFGVADLINLKDLEYLFANKMLPEVDYGAISCWASYLADRIASNPTIDLENYRDIQVVRFNRNRKKWRKNLSLFQC
uniref:Core-2/I-Branching enzyme n=1 Tax=Elaeophora elaphi TaxID=1147741 RepID=A0A0R3RHG5_9BILA